VKVWLGFRSVDVPPSPNDHHQEAAGWVEVSVNFTVNGATPRFVLRVKDVPGARKLSLALFSCAILAQFVPARISTQITKGRNQSMSLPGGIWFSFTLWSQVGFMATNQGQCCWY
jgi:hypothetical protein